MTEDSPFIELRAAIDKYCETRDFVIIEQFLFDHPQYPDDSNMRAEIARAIKHLGYVRGFIKHAKLAR